MSQEKLDLSEVLPKKPSWGWPVVVMVTTILLLIVLAAIGHRF